MALTILQNDIGYVDLPTSAVDTGWVISGIYAIHSSCNSGIIKNKVPVGLVVGKTYTVTYTVDNYSSGTVKLILGTTNGTVRSANGTYSETLVCAGAPTMTFFSDGNLRISLLNFYDIESGVVPGTTITFNEAENQWGSDQPFQPEVMIKFVDGFFTIKNGQMWEHNTNPVRGNFYGQDYPALVTFIVNVDYKKDKIFYNFRIDGKGKWFAPSLTTAGSNQFPNGMLSRLKKNNVKQIDGKLWAEILGDINDPNFTGPTAQLDALFGGRKMQGGWLIVSMRCDDTNEVNLDSIETYYTTVFRDQ